jgi:hypothetical protein
VHADDTGDPSTPDSDHFWPEEFLRTHVVAAAK